MYPNMSSGRSPLHEQGLQEGRRPWSGVAIHVPPVTVETVVTDAQSIDLASLHTRPHEVFERVTGFTPRQRCQHGKQIVTVMAHWSDDAPFTVTTGCQNSTQRYTRTVHVDGTPSGNGDTSICCHGVRKFCPGCDAEDTLTTKQLAYGDETTCAACGWSRYYSIGD